MILAAVHFNPRPPRGGRLTYRRYDDYEAYISIHAPREGGDKSYNSYNIYNLDFNPRPPRGGRPCCYCCSWLCWHFNPRPPRGGRPNNKSKAKAKNEFQSTPPARGATCILMRITMLYLFQSTPPARGATNKVIFVSHSTAISIHAPREGGDSNRQKPYQE